MRVNKSVQRDQTKRGVKSIWSKKLGTESLNKRETEQSRFRENI